MNPQFTRFALLTTLFSTSTSYALTEIYVQPAENVCYETYYGNGTQPLPHPYYAPAPTYSVTPEVISLPIDDCGGGTFFRADLLYWKTNENGLNRCVPTTTYERVDCDGYALSVRKEKNNDPSFDWDPGFRIALGYNFLDTHWELAAYWSNLHTKAGSHLANGGKLRCNLDFNAVDLLVSYKFCVVPSFSMKPFFGLRVTTVNQTLKTNVEYQYEFENHHFSHFQGNNKQKFVGVGPLVGLEGVLHLKHNTSLYASAAVAGLYGDYNLNFKNCNRFQDGETLYHLRQHLHSWDAALDFAIGFRWEHCLKRVFSKSPQNVWLTFDFGLEHHHYFRLNRFNSSQQSGSKRRGDLYFDGFNIAAKIAY